MPNTPLSGSVQLVFAGSTTCAMTLTDVNSASFTLDTTNITANAAVVSQTCGGSIPDGTYTVLLAYQNLAGDPPNSAAATNVTVSTPLTLPPTLTTPAASATYSGTVPVSYTLPEAPQSGSVMLRFVGATTCELTMSDSQNVSFTLTPSAVTVAPPIAASTCGSTIPTGTYSVSLSYSDAGGAPVATALSSNVVLAPAVATTTTTTTPATTTTAVTPTTGATTTTLAASPTTTAARSLAGTGLAATGAANVAPATLLALGAAIAGVGLLTLRRARR